MVIHYPHIYTLTSSLCCGYVVSVLWGQDLLTDSGLCLTVCVAKVYGYRD